MAMDSRAQLISRMASQLGLDPAAVLSIADVEGGFNGAVGDNGTSFGPFQLHEGGALPSQFNGNPSAAQAWANSPAGFKYALNAINQVAHGLKGQSAIAAISSRFERPANVPGEIANASSRYGQFGNPAGLGSMGTGTVAGTPSGSAYKSNPGLSLLAGMPNQSQSTTMPAPLLLAMSLLGQGQSGQPLSPLQLGMQRQIFGAAAQSPLMSSNPLSAVLGAQ